MRCKWLLLFVFCGAAAAQGVMTTYVGTDWVFPGDGLPALNAPLGPLWGITLDPDGNPVLVDHNNCIVAKIRPDATLSVIAGNGFCGLTFLLSGDGGPATSAKIWLPYSATYDPHGNLYVSTGFQVRRIAPDGTVSLFAGSPTLKSGFSGDGRPATQALIDTFGGLASDTLGNIYLADGFNNRIRKIDRDGAISTFAGNGTASFGGDGGPATAAMLDGMSAVAVDVTRSQAGLNELRNDECHQGHVSIEVGFQCVAHLVASSAHCFLKAMPNGTPSTMLWCTQRPSVSLH
jgi:DNA-binding beta-propeller fold protein YncE